MRIWDPSARFTNITDFTHTNRWALNLLNKCGVSIHFKNIENNPVTTVLSLSSTSLDITPIANGSAANGQLVNKPILIPNGGPSTMVPCSPETPLANGVVNGHITPVQESPFIGYIIAMHRKMVSIVQLDFWYF